jgi:hypothetical protein
MISRPWSEWRLPVGSSARMRRGWPRARGRPRPAAAGRRTAARDRGPSSPRCGSGRACRRRWSAAPPSGRRGRRGGSRGSRRRSGRPAGGSSGRRSRCSSSGARASASGRACGHVVVPNRNSPVQAESWSPRMLRRVDLPEPEGPMIPRRRKRVALCIIDVSEGDPAQGVERAINGTLEHRIDAVDVRVCIACRRRHGIWLMGRAHPRQPRPPCSEAAG